MNAQQIQSLIPVNWAPKLGALFVAVGSFMAASGPSDRWKFAGGLLSAAGAALVGFTARQWNKSSEDNNLPPPTAPAV